jgi:hypothetical protein
MNKKGYISVSVRICRKPGCTTFPGTKKKVHQHSESLEPPHASIMSLGLSDRFLKITGDEIK